MSFAAIYTGGFLLRLGLYLYSMYQDLHSGSPVKFTDIDYSVFTDAGTYTRLGQSPYQRSTYRYTPLLAYLNAWNTWRPDLGTLATGKWIFTLGDFVTGFLILEILSLQSTARVSQRARKWILGLWLLNPFVAIISMRGSAESLIGVLVLSTLYFHLKKQYTLSAILYGLSVHFKIYPIIFALPLWLAIEPYSNLASSSSSKTSIKKKALTAGFFTWPRFRFGLISGFVFLGFLALFYGM